MGDINKWLEDQIENNLIPTLMDYIRIPNQSRLFDPEWQTNGLSLKVCEFAKKWAEAQKLDNFTIEIVQEEGRTPCLLAILDTPNAANVLMYGHLDKQPPLTEQWSTGLHPYHPVIKNDRLYGRGSADDGYAFFASVLILKALQTFKLPTSRVVLFFETDEESGSRDLVYLLEKNAAKVGNVDLVICLDSGTCDYEHWCLITTLRGNCKLQLKVEVSKEGVHSGTASGIIPDTFRIARKILEQLESAEDGHLYVPDLYVNIPEDKYQQARCLIKELGGSIDWKFPFLPGVQPTVEDGFKQYINRIWMPQLTSPVLTGYPTSPTRATSFVRRPRSASLSACRPPCPRTWPERPSPSSSKNSPSPTTPKSPRPSEGSARGSAARCSAQT